jgi:hypothetical protein
MPRSVDNIAVHKRVVGDFMKTQDFFHAEAPVQEGVTTYLDGLEWLEQEQAAKAAMQQSMMAQQLGSANAARPQGPIPAPDMPGGSTPQPSEPVPALG